VQDERRSPAKSSGTSGSADRRRPERLHELALSIIAVPCGSTVEDEWLPELHSYLDVRLKVFDLIRERRVVTFCVNSCLPDRNDLGLSGARQQGGALTRLICCVMWMDSDRGVHPVVFTCNLHCSL
jgi:hypothetical protein